MKKLLEHIIEKGLKPMSFSVYNYMDDNGYITEMENYLKTNLVLNDFEYMVFNLTEQEKNGLKYRNKEIISKFENLKIFLEKTIQQENTKTILFILKDEAKVFLVNLKDFGLIENIEKLLILLK